MNQRIEDIICDAVNILVDSKINSLEFDKTIQATILECVDESTGRYKVKYQNSTFTAYSSNLDVTYRTSQLVYITVPNGDFNNTKTILGTVDKLGAEYVKIVDKERQVTKLTGNVAGGFEEMGLCSYRGVQSIELLDTGLSIDINEVAAVSSNANTIILSGTFLTALEEEQKRGNGNYGLILTAKFYNSAYKQDDQTSDDLITRQYTLDLHNMSGQPYNFTTASRQYAIFPLDGENLKEITSIQFFSQNFPKYDSTINESDIYVKNLEIYLAKTISSEELNGTFLTLSKPLGGYFNEGNIDNEKAIKVGLRAEGYEVDLSDGGDAKIFWYVRDNSVDDDSDDWEQHGDNGWRCLNNKTVYSDGFTQWYPASNTLPITASMCNSKATEFRCVVEYNGVNVSATTTFINYTVGEVTIESSNGTDFNFDYGETDLTALVDGEVHNEYTYIWTRKVDDSVSRIVEPATASIQGIEIKDALNVVEYSVTVLVGSTIIGSASIALVNSHELGQYRLVLNNANQVFKYNGRGVSPTSLSTPEKDRITLLPLTFDIYDEKGHALTLSDTDKVRMCDVIWHMPTSSNSLLTWSGSSTIVDSAQLIFGIANTYDINKSDNTIELEVVYKGLQMTARTNFSFFKEGQLGTNGTEYVARIVPRAGYERVFVAGGRVYGFDGTKVTQITTPHLLMQLFNGENTPVYSNNSGTWDLMKLVPAVNKTKNITISDGNISPVTALEQSTVIRATITSNQYSALAKNYYGYYPLQVVSGSLIAFVDDGFDSVEYDSDGTRPSYTKRAFRLRVFNASGNEISVSPSNIAWSNSWNDETLINSNSYLPSVSTKYLNENNNCYVMCQYGSSIIYVSVHHYLNQYGMNDVNGWDGNKIEIDDNGNYIIAPQIAAGTKDSANRYTGVVIGKTMQDSGASDNGIMAYSEGSRTVFIDAKTGNAFFGISGAGQIQINGENSLIQSGNYSYGKEGMKIDLKNGTIDTHYFKVDSSGQVRAEEVYIKGEIEATEGSIGGWTINSSNISSIGDRIVLNSNGSISTASGKFSVNTSGEVSITGNINATTGRIGNWYIRNNQIESSDGSLIIGTNGIKYGTNFSVSNAGAVSAKSGFIGDWQIKTDGSLQNGQIKLQYNGLDFMGGTGGLGIFNSNSNTIQIWGNLDLDGGSTFECNALLDLWGNGIERVSYIEFNDSNHTTLTPNSFDLSSYATRSWVAQQDQNVLGVVKTYDLKTFGVSTTSAGNIDLKGSVNAASVTWCNESFEKKSGSDKRLKQNIQKLKIEDILPIYNQLKPVSYYFKTNTPFTDNKKHYGLIAQDIEKFFPSDNDGFLQKQAVAPYTELYKNFKNMVGDDFYLLDYNNFHALHIIMIQYLLKEIQELKEKIK